MGEKKGTEEEEMETQDKLWTSPPAQHSVPQAPLGPQHQVCRQHLPASPRVARSWHTLPVQQLASTDHKGPFLWWMFVLGPVRRHDSLQLLL